MFNRSAVSRRFAWKKVLDVPGYTSAIRRRKWIHLSKLLVSGATTGFLFGIEWYTASTFASMLTATLWLRRFSDPTYKNLVLSMEVNDEDKSRARIKTPKGYRMLNVDSITSLTDVYPAYRALQSANELLNSNTSKVAAFEGDSSQSHAANTAALLNTIEDTMGHSVSVSEGRTVPYHEFADRFHFFLREDDEVYVVGFPFSPEVVFDCEELMRVLAGNKPLKPRRSVALAEADEQVALEAQEKVRLRLKGEPQTQLPGQEKKELPGESPAN